MKPRIAISFSGGRTSAVMTKLLFNQYKNSHEISIEFANTGREHPDTLDFVHKCDTIFSWGVVWLEAEVCQEKGVGVRHRIVDYKTASRDGKPFRDYIAKYGIPNMGSPQCTTRLKENVLDSYRRSKGWKRATFSTAIGIRADEAHRVSARAKEMNFIYPLVDEGWTKQMVIDEVSKWGFDLGLREHEGNCIDCWKKSFRKLATLSLEQPESFEFTREMERAYSKHKVTPATSSPDGRRLFFRGHRTVDDIFAMAKAPGFIPFVDGYFPNQSFPDPLDYGVGCGESCEIGSDERYGVEPLEDEDKFWD